jgi:hypothetical protein
MPSMANLMLRSAQRARLEARRELMQPRFARLADTFTRSQDEVPPPAVSRVWPHPEEAPFETPLAAAPQDRRAVSKGACRGKRHFQQPARRG